MIPLSLVTGFLGSGKTTLLGHLAGQLADRRVVFLVNEFSPVDADGAQLTGLGPDTVAIPGGSIFCRCLTGEFLRHLREIPQRFHRPGEAIDGVIVEASGIADPRVAGDMLAETHLDEVYELKHIISVVDPGSFAKLLATLPNIRAQVESADVLLINKTDLHTPDQLRDVSARLTEINPQARQVRCCHAQVDLDVLTSGTKRDVHGDYAPCVDPHYARRVVTPAGDVDVEQLARRLGELGSDVFRAKGYLATPAGAVYVDYAAGRTSVEPASSPEVLALSLITAGPAEPPSVTKLCDDLQAGRLAPADAG